MEKTGGRSNIVPADISGFISSIRLPLIVAVVFIHAVIVRHPNEQILEYEQKIFSIVLPSVAVPLFFFISGFLFFGYKRTFGGSDYCNKLRKRIRTLLIPYIVWNAFAVAVFWMIHRYVPSIINPSFENVSEYSTIQLFRCFWDGSGGYPINYPLWFLRDLIVIDILSPLVFIFVSKFRRVGLYLLLLLFIFFNYKWLNVFIYFTIGAYFSIHRINFLQIYKNKVGVLCLLACVFGILAVCQIESVCLLHLYIIFCCAFIFSVGNIIHKRMMQIAHRYGVAAFFVYVAHGLPILITDKILAKFYNVIGSEEWGVIINALYLLNPIVLTVTLISIYYLLRMISPQLIMLITGNR